MPADVLKVKIWAETNKRSEQPIKPFLTKF